jgi:hypothetical protein
MDIFLKNSTDNMLGVTLVKSLQMFMSIPALSNALPRRYGVRLDGFPSDRMKLVLDAERLC